MVKTQVVIPKQDFDRLWQKLCNISGYARSIISYDGPLPHTVEALLASLECIQAEVGSALELLEEDDGLYN